MRSWLEGLGWTDTWINICEIFIYLILILSGIIAIIKQTRKAIIKLVPKFKEIKGFKKKLLAVKKFYQWYKKAVKDGVITDEEINSINTEFYNIINNTCCEKDIQPDSKHYKDIRDFIQTPLSEGDEDE